MDQFPMSPLDWVAFGAFFVALSAIGYWAGRKERAGAEEYFLAGKRLPWYVIGGSFIASNISSEHFIGMIGAACVFGICVAMSEWANVVTFSLLIWVFIPFLLVSKVFTTPEFLERRFSPALRQVFAVVTIISNVLAFLAAVLYGGAIALRDLFGWDFWFAVVALGVVAGVWAIYGGLSSVAWTDLYSVVVMVFGGLVVTILGLYALAGDGGSLADGARTMLERNQATTGRWAEAVNTNLDHLAGQDHYNRLSVFQPLTHPTTPWASLLFAIFSVSIWYNVLNQFMIQRVLGAKNMYHARMGIVLAGFLKVLLPAIVVVPGLILFALKPEILLQPWESVKPAADTGYVALLRTLVPAGLRGLFLAALFGAIQSTVNAVLNSTATVFTLDIYQRWINPRVSDRGLVVVGVVCSTVVLAIAIVLAGCLDHLGESLFVYIQSLYAFFAPPFAAVFLLGILWRRVNAKGAIVTVVAGFLLAIAVKLYFLFGPAMAERLGSASGMAWLLEPPRWLAPFANQAAVNWAFCMVVCTVTSLLTAPPRPDQITDDVTVNWRKLNIFSQLGDRWYTSVVLWWAVFALMTVALMIFFSGLVFPTRP